MLRRSPGFSILAILCLTLGIGATTSVFSWIEGILLRPFPLVQNQDRLVAVCGLNRGTRTDVSWPDFQDLKKNCRLIETFIGDPSICRLYLGMSKLDGETAEALRKAVPFTRLRVYSHVLDFFGGMFEIRGGKAVVPGGQRSLPRDRSSAPRRARASAFIAERWPGSQARRDRDVAFAIAGHEPRGASKRSPQ